MATPDTARHRFHISSPADKARLSSHRVAIQGEGRRSSGAVQLFVKANDNQWYPQADVRYAGHRWRGVVVLGDHMPSAPSGSPYLLVALRGHQKVTAKVIAALPTGAGVQQSNERLVFYDYE